MRVLFTISLLLFIVSCTQKSEDLAEKDQDVVEKIDGHSYPKIPTQMMLFGNSIEIDNFDIKERLDKEVIVNTYYHSSTVQILKRANRYFPLIEKVLAEEGMPDDMKYLCVIESALRQVTSPTGAKGFWQFMSATAKDYGMRITSDVDERLDVEKSTRAACDYMKDANRKFDDWIMAAASYNCGVRGLNLYVQSQGIDNFFELHLNHETSRYVFRIMALKLLMESPEDYGFFPLKMELYEPVEVKQIEVNTSISSLSDWALENGSNLHMVKVLNPWLIGNSLTISDGRTYSIALLKK
ncbi:MAG: lytic transglycosylase domain-containing protein [Crocinitomicaceae bacterium]|nr:lytic transglycosylase domain-containing protein [Crocinitomicaceae bacterium]|tara:strand:+ start:3463 stop:4353 length:891 start_codon:yes stop_codon:yes gene_type:complete